ncbi:MAG: arsenite S-adenosylmethyltransferase [Chloroflexi bacterium RBG_13_51_18]|nr:MAG: arsenite S-adenosylmethyltransferase [Chloroflexi bacterium RBG_13_51_18]
MKETEIKKSVREKYGEIAKEGSSCCNTGNTSCCNSSQSTKDISKSIGYSEDDVNNVPEGANLGLGCGNPIALASLKEGETVIDLGSGAGFDCFLAAKRVGGKGRIIGVDMTPEMLEKARENARNGNYNNVEFRLGEIENLPVPDNTADIIISNCVINLAPDKKKVFKEAYRVLKPGGRLMVSDIVLTKALPEFIRESIMAYIGCIAGAALENEYLGAIEDAGFTNVRVADETGIALDSLESDPIASSIVESLKMTPEQMRDVASSIKSIRVSAVKAVKQPV